MAEPFATSSQLASAWRALTEQEASAADQLLVYASALLRRHTPDIDVRLEDGTLDVALPELAVIEMVKRALRNPEGLRSDSTGPFSASWDPELATGRLEVTAADMALVAAVGPAGRVRNIVLRAGLR